MEKTELGKRAESSKLNAESRGQGVEGGSGNQRAERIGHGA